jgi:hypothetical protein
MAPAVREPDAIRDPEISRSRKHNPDLNRVSVHPKSFVPGKRWPSGMIEYQERDLIEDLRLNTIREIKSKE